MLRNAIEICSAVSVIKAEKKSVSNANNFMPLEREIFLNQALFNIVYLGRPPVKPLSAILRRTELYGHFFPAQTLKNALDDSGESAWLCSKICSPPISAC